MDRTKALLDIQNLNPAHPDNIGQLKEAETASRQLVAETFGAKTTRLPQKDKDLIGKMALVYGAASPGAF